MNALPDLHTYQDPEALTPPDDPVTCPDCGRECCPTWCTPTFPSPYRSRYAPRVENGDPES